MTLDAVTIRNTLGHGLFLWEGGVRLNGLVTRTCEFSRVEDAGLDPDDYDGIRVNEHGSGGIKANINLSQIQDNGGDGVELDEQDDGDVVVTVNASGLNNNGFANDDARRRH